MKNLILFIFATISCIELNAQDILYLKSGIDVNVKVCEVGKKEIKYKKFNNLDGPVYTISIKNIDRIIYQNGEEESSIQNNETRHLYLHENSKIFELLINDFYNSYSESDLNCNDRNIKCWKHIKINKIYSNNYNKSNKKISSCSWYSPI